MKLQAKLQTVSDILNISLAILFVLSIYQIKGMKEEISQLKQQVTVLSESKATN
jgi:hypothetical protein